MSRQQMQKIFIFLLGLFLLFRLIPHIKANYVYLLVSKAYSAQLYSSDKRIKLLTKAFVIDCKHSSDFSCGLDAYSPNHQLEMMDQYFMEDLGSLQIITNSVKIPIRSFLRVKQSTSFQVAEPGDVLHGIGFFRSRIFLLSDEESCWRFDIKAQHDAPPPIILEIWVDNEKFDTVTYTKGDQSWETLSTYAYLKPYTYWLHIWYVNDFFDMNANVDRNARLEYVALTQVEAEYCENH